MQPSTQPTQRCCPLTANATPPTHTKVLSFDCQSANAVPWILYTGVLTLDCQSASAAPWTLHTRVFTLNMQSAAPWTLHTDMHVLDCQCSPVNPVQRGAHLDCQCSPRNPVHRGAYPRLPMQLHEPYTQRCLSLTANAAP